MGSSDPTPSDHSSVFDAETIQTGEQASNEYLLTDRSAGTRLCTITERNSIRTLKTLPSVRTFQGRIASVDREQILQDLAETGNVPRRRCFSVDDIVKRVVGSSVDLPEVPEKAWPPQEPPYRRRTPPGVPRWPGEIDYASDTHERRHWGAYLTSLRWLLPNGASSRTGRETDEIRQRSRGRRYWRPPVSGHSTHRFAQLSSHPFVAAPDMDTFSPARRALTSVGEYNVPVTPSRAAAKAAQRSAALPVNVRSNALAHRSTRLTMSLYPRHHIEQPTRREILNICRRKFTRVRVTRGIPSPRPVSHQAQTAFSLDGSEPYFQPRLVPLDPRNNQSDTATGSPLTRANAIARTRSLPQLREPRSISTPHRTPADSTAAAHEVASNHHRPVLAHAHTTPAQMPLSADPGCRA